MIYDLPLSGGDQPRLRRRQRIFKRIMDISISLAALVICAPIMGIVAVLICLEAKGPVLFVQRRVGEGGRIFTMYKFRTMIPHAEWPLDGTVQGHDDVAQLHKRADDPRVTPLGRLLRRCSLDELPQFYNVLRGDMSVVGPRPELTWLVEQYEPWQYQRLVIPQGLTGLWQINGRADRPMHLSTDIDIYYLENYSLWLDLVILLKTPLAVVRGDGAY